MAIEVELPDGSVVEFPEGTPNAVMEGALKQHAQASWKPRQRSPADLRQSAEFYRAGHNEAAGDNSFGKNTLLGFGKSLVDTARGVGQLTGMVDSQDVDRAREMDRDLMGTGGGNFGSVLGTVSQAAAPLTGGAKAFSMLGRAAPVARGAVSGAAFAGLQPVGTGESRGSNVGWGAGLGAGGAAIAPVLRAGASKVDDIVRPEVKALYEAAKARGINLSPAQLSDSRFMKFLASTMQGLPGSGAKAKAANQSAAFNREVAREIGADAPIVTPEVYAKTKALQSRQFEALTSRNDLKVTPDVVTRLEAHAKEAEAAGPDVAAAVRSAVDRFYGAAQTGERGVFVPGRDYQALDSALGQVTKRGDTTAHFVGNVKGAIREAMDASISPKDKTAWDALRRNYGNRKTVRDLVSKGDGGELSPAQLMGRVTATNYGKEAMATGQRGGLGELARIGQRIKEPPSSGTAERMLAAQSLNPLAWPIMGARFVVGATAGRAANSNGLASLMASGSGARTLDGLARLVDKARPQTLLPAAFVATQAKAKTKKPKKDDPR